MAYNFRANSFGTHLVFLTAETELHYIPHNRASTPPILKRSPARLPRPILGLPIHSSLQLSALLLPAFRDHVRNPASSQNPAAPSVAGDMHPGRQGQGRHRGGGGAADADFVGTGFALVLSAVSCLLLLLGDGGGQPASTLGVEWQVILAFGTMAGGLLLVMHGIRARGAQPPVLVRRVAGAAGAVLWHAGGPERLLPVVALLLLPFLEAWFDFF